MAILERAYYTGLTLVVYRKEILNSLILVWHEHLACPLEVTHTR
jgi:hypothetical protein